MSDPALPLPAGLPAPVRGALWMVAGAAAFAVMTGLVRLVSAELHPFEIAFFRNLFGLAFMVPWLVQSGLGSLRTRRWGLYTLRGIFGLAAMLTWFYALSVMPLAEATALSFTSPLFATAAAGLFLGEVVRLRRWTAVIIGFIGTLVILRPGFAEVSLAQGLVLMSAAAMAGAVITIKMLSRTEPVNAIVTYMVVFLTPMSLLPALFVWRTPDLETLLWLVAIGGFGTAGHLSITRAFRAADASAMMIFDFARLPFAAVVGFIAFGEGLDLWTWVGAAVIAAAAVYIAHREAKLEQPARTPRAAAKWTLPAELPPRQ